LSGSPEATRASQKLQNAVVAAAVPSGGSAASAADAAQLPSKEKFEGASAPPLGTAAATSEDKYKLEMAFSRGLYSGWMHGVNHQKLVHARYGKKRGAYLGTITSIGRGYIETKPAAPIKPGDGIVIDRGGDTDREQGGRVYEVHPLRDGAVRLAFEYGKLDFNVIKLGHHLWKTDDPQLNKELRKSFAGELAKPKRALNLTITGRIGEPLKIEGQCEGITATVTSQIPLELAQKRPLTNETLRTQLGRLGETDLELASLDNQLQGQVILPVSELNRLRRELVDRIQTNAQPKSPVILSEGERQTPSSPTTLAEPQSKDLAISPKTTGSAATHLSSKPPTLASSPSNSVNSENLVIPSKSQVSIRLAALAQKRASIPPVENPTLTVL